MAPIAYGSTLSIVNIVQTVAVRTSGFNSIDFTKLPTAILWLYTGSFLHDVWYYVLIRFVFAGMMYIAASPIAITVRYTGKSKSESIAGIVHNAK